MLKKILFLVLICFCIAPSATHAQFEGEAFLQYQLGYPRVAAAYRTYNTRLQTELKQKGYQYPVDDIYLRSFKAQSELEVWIRNKGADTFSLFKTYKICALSGALGPKRIEGDRQVPEGFYFISNFNPTSDYYLSLLINYPNYSDRIMGNKLTPGGDIYIHGGCVTVGCLPMTDAAIQEIYVLCLNARAAGQTNIPVHIYPTRFDKETVSYLGQAYKDDQLRHRFWVNIKSGYDYFQRTHKLMPVMYNQEGRYIF